MKKYILLRTLRSLLSIFVVTALTYTIIYTMVPRRLIFRQDPNYNKIAKTADSKVPNGKHKLFFSTKTSMSGEEVLRTYR